MAGKTGEPTGDREVPDPGEQRTGAPPTPDPTGPGQPGAGEAGWGELPPYLQFLRHRGSRPRMPDAFRKFYEAYLKAEQRKKDDR